MAEYSGPGPTNDNASANPNPEPPCETLADFTQAGVSDLSDGPDRGVGTTAQPVALEVPLQAKLAPSEMEQAYAELLPRIQAIPKAHLIPITIDVPVAVTTVLGVALRLEALLPELSAALPGAALQQPEDLRRYALALLGAHLNYQMFCETALVVALVDREPAFCARPACDQHGAPCPSAFDAREDYHSAAHCHRTPSEFQRPVPPCRWRGR